MTKTIDFSTLSLQDALDLAILIEEEAAERYEELAEQMEAHHTPDAGEFFRTMIKNEKKHGSDLAKRRAEMFGDAETKVDRSMLWEVEAPGYDSVEMFMSAGRALSVALDSEKKAFQFFVDALEHITDGEVKALFEELRDEELAHQDLVLKELAKLPDEESPDREAFADDPVAQ